MGYLVSALHAGFEWLDSVDETCLLLAPSQSPRRWSPQLEAEQDEVEYHAEVGDTLIDVFQKHYQERGIVICFPLKSQERCRVGR